MRKILLFFFLLSAIGLIAQPINDDCGGIIDLGEGISCTDSIYNNVNATASTVFSDPTSNIPDCWNSVNQDVWFMFTVPADGSIIDYTITIEGVDDGSGTNAITNPQVALYRGDCGLDNLAELLCESAELGETSVSFDAALLTPTIPYFIRVDNYSATGNIPPGAFTVCVDSIMVENNIDDGGSTACEGTLFDSGGPDGDYMSNENNVFTICPTGLNNSINFTMEFFNTEFDNIFDQPIDVINFYDGDNTTAAPLGSLGGGGTCFQTCATSGCLTIEFISDAQLNFEGFMGFWECSIEPCAVPEPIIVDPTITDQQIIEATASPLTQVTIDTIICADGSFGTFESPATANLGLEKGLILSSGLVADAPGPNNDFLNNASTGMGTLGDADLDYLSSLGNGDLSNDACIVELDVFVNTNELTFEYVFGSEEYPEYVLEGFNDIFAFLVSGPGITGDPNINNQENIAIIPNTNIPVEIDAVNGQVNWEYYRDNTNGLSVNYDGLTGDYPGGKKSLTAKVQTEPCNTYHLKLAVADRGDGIFDSAVFVSDIKAGVPNIAANFGSGLDYLIEGCAVGQDELIISLTTDIADSITYTVVVGGSATPGVDYSLSLPQTITFSPGATSFSFPIAAIPDAIAEVSENITIALTSDFGCGVVQAATLDIAINDTPVVEINAGADTVFVCADEGLELSVEGAQFYFWEPVSVFDDPSSNMPVATISQSQWVTVTGNVANCVDVDSIYLLLIDPEVTIVPQTATDVCQGTPVVLEAVNNVNGQGLMWTPNMNISDNTDEIVTVTPNFNTIYTASIQIANCIVSDEITINVDPFDFPDLTTTDTTLCQGELITLAADIPFTNTTYQWTPDADLIPDGTVAGPSAIPQDDIVYTVVATSENGFCTQTGTVNVEVIPADISLMPEDTVFICLGESVNINATTTTNDITWSSSDVTIDGSTDLNITVMPNVTTLYNASMSIGACTVNDSLLVRVDSLPDMSIISVPDSPYCIGEIVTMISPTYEPFNFPDIEHNWSPPIGAESEIDDYNFVITALETTTYTRTTTNNGCTETNSIEIDVIDPTIVLAFGDTLVCPGEEVQLLVLSDAEELEWSPASGLSCSDCPDPIVTPFATTQYTVTGDTDGCPGSATVNVQVRNPPGIFIQSTPGGNIPQGEDVTLTAITNPDVSTTGAFDWLLNGNPFGPDAFEVTTTIVDSDNNFTVNLVDEFGCITSADLYIFGSPPAYDIPSAFTPDGDGLNDVFKFLHEGNVEMESFQIFNRWGQQVFETRDIDMGWDGTFKGTMAPSDVYVYLIKFNLPGQADQILKGDVTLIR